MSGYFFLFPTPSWGLSFQIAFVVEIAEREYFEPKYAVNEESAASPLVEHHCPQVCTADAAHWYSFMQLSQKDLLARHIPVDQEWTLVHLKFEFKTWSKQKKNNMEFETKLLFLLLQTPHSMAI